MPVGIILRCHDTELWTRDSRNPLLIAPLTANADLHADADADSSGPMHSGCLISVQLLSPRRDSLRNRCVLNILIEQDNLVRRGVIAEYFDISAVFASKFM